MKRLLTLLTTTAVMVLMFASAAPAEVLPPTGHNGCDVCEDVFGAIAGPTAIATAEGSVGCDVCLYYINPTEPTVARGGKAEGIATWRGVKRESPCHFYARLFNSR